MSYMLPHLHNGWQVDQAILSEEDRVIVIRFGHDWDPTCMKMDEVLYSIAEKVRSARSLTALPLQNSSQTLPSSLCFTGKKFRCHLPGGHHRSARLQQDVWAVRPLHRHVLFQVEQTPTLLPVCRLGVRTSCFPCLCFQEQTHHDWFGHR